MLKSVVLALIVAQGAAAGKAATELEKVLSAYHKAKAVSMSFKKASVNELIETERTANGRLVLRGSLLRMETEKPEKALLIMDGKDIWFIQTVQNGDAESTIVNKSSAQNLRHSNSVIAALFDSRKVLKQFNVSDPQKAGDKKMFTLTPKKADASEIRKLEIQTQKDELVTVTYWDYRQNKTIYNFSDINFAAKIDKAEFSYTPPKGAEIMEH